MTLETFSVLLSYPSLALGGVSALALIAYGASSRMRTWVQAQPYWLYQLGIAIVSGGAVVGAMIYQLVYLTPVCELCWWQRIFLFPVVIIAGVAAIRGWRKGFRSDAHISTGILSALGLLYAIYHYYYHFQGLVLGNSLTLPCSSGGLLPACTTSPILTFGFITIPFLGIMTFLSLLTLAFFASRARLALGNTDAV